MNKALFWTGLGFQIIQILALGVFGLTLIDWSFLTLPLFLIVTLIFINFISILFMLIGAISG